MTGLYTAAVRVRRRRPRILIEDAAAEISKCRALIVEFPADMKDQQRRPEL